MRGHPNMSAQGDDLGNYPFPCSTQNNDTCKAVMNSHLLASLFSAYCRYLSFFWQRSDTLLSKLTADWWNDESWCYWSQVRDVFCSQCVMLWVSEHFVTSQYVMLCIAHREFCGREDFDTCGEISGLTHSGLWWLWWRSGRWGRSLGEGGVDVWYGMRHLVHCIITLCIVHCHIWGYILWSISFTCHGSTAANKGRSVLFMYSVQGHSLEVSTVAGLGLRAVPEPESSCHLFSSANQRCH